MQLFQSEPSLLRTLIHQGLQQLPGWKAQRMMAPSIREDDPPMMPDFGQLRNSAVLLLIHPVERDLEIVYTLRTQTLPTHSGQISFPGGRCEPGESFIDTALREAEEEIGLSADYVEVLGTLSPLPVPHSRSLIHPIVGLLEEKPLWNPNPSEVEEVFEVKASELLDPSRLKTELWNLRGQEYKVPFWDVHPKVPLWGATALITSEMLQVLNLLK